MRENYAAVAVNKDNRSEGLGLSFLNVPTTVWDNGEYWETVEFENGLKLQQNNITGHARIINNRKIRLAWGDMKAMRKAFIKLVKPWEQCKRGDILAVQRANGIYSHYAVYIGRGKVIHYAADDSDFGAEASIHEGNFWDFLGCDTCFDILSFSEYGDTPNHKRIDLVSSGRLSFNYPYKDAFSEFDKYIRKLKGYHLYSPEETVARAESRVGENKYSLAFNNCEHFALWCKTGIQESTQVEEVIKRLIFGVIRASNIRKVMESERMTNNVI